MKLREILRLPALNLVHSAIGWCALGFVISYVYTLYPEDTYYKDWYLFTDKHEQNARGHLYFLGERFRWIAYTRALYILTAAWQVEIFFLLEGWYFVDYIGWFNDTNYGRIKGLIMIIVAFITFIEWKKSSNT